MSGGAEGAKDLVLLRLRNSDDTVQELLEPLQTCPQDKGHVLKAHPTQLFPNPTSTVLLNNGCKDYC